MSDAAHDYTLQKMIKVFDMYLLLGSLVHNRHHKNLAVRLPKRYPLGLLLHSRCTECDESESLVRDQLERMHTSAWGGKTPGLLPGCPDGAAMAKEPLLADVRNSVATCDNSSFHERSYLQEKTDTRTHYA